MKVVAPIEDTPAYRAGLKSATSSSSSTIPPVKGLSTLNDAVKKMRANRRRRSA